MDTKPVMKFALLGGLAFGLIAFLALLPAAKPRTAGATANPLAPLLTCPNVDGSDNNKVTVADILSVVKKFPKEYGQTGYGPLWDLVSPYNSTSPTGTGKITVADIIAVIGQYNVTCPVVDTEVAKATRAIGDPLFMDILCDDAGALKYQAAVNCGGDEQFLTENASFLSSRGYFSTGIDVPGQGLHYVNLGLFDGVFNPVRPEGLVYNNGALMAQLYYGEGDVIGWGTDRDNNKGAVNTDAFPCTPDPAAPPTIGCGWDGANDGWHWHKNLCTTGIGTNPSITIMPSQQACSDWGAIRGITCTFPPTPNFTCNWQPTVGWMGHLWNWLPNANYTNAVDPGPNGLQECTAQYCAATESNGRFADCFPDAQNWNAYNCPQ
jgi:hypothetical protein